MNATETRVVVVDSHPIVREGLRQFLEANGGCRVIAEAGDAEAALYASENHEHDVLLTNATIPGSDIFRLIQNFKKKFPERKVVVCYIGQDAGLLQEFKNAGTDGFIGQNATSGEYSVAVKAVIEGGNFFSENLTNIIFQVKSAVAGRKNAYDLTNRELEVLSLLANGYCNKEIANKHNLSVRTVETHRLSIRRKTNSNTLSHLVRVARSLGLSSMGGEMTLDEEPDRETSGTDS